MTSGIPLVSVLIRVCRIDPFTIPSIKSILTQSLSEIEVLLICNGPKAMEVKQALSASIEDYRVKYISTPLNGLAFLLNLGISSASAECIAIHDADDISEVDRLRMQYDYLKANSDVGIVGCRVKLIDHNGATLKDPFPFAARHSIIKSLSPVINLLCHPALMFRAKSLTDVGGYVYGYRSEDHDLFLRLFAETKWKAHNLDTFLFSYRRHPAQLTGKVSAKLFAEYSAPLLIRFLQTLNPLFIIGVIYVSPPIIFLKRKIRIFVRTFLPF